MRIAAIGGGHGLSRSLQALATLGGELTAIVTVADDGGSSGRLRRELDVAPPGDLRMALAALSDDPELARLLQYRFDAGELSGHALGNLIIVAAQELTGGLVAGLARVGQALGARGRVVPCTTTPLVLHSQSAKGHHEGQVAVATNGPHERVWLEPSDPTATEEAVTAVREADLIVLGPGSIFTSILPNLLVPELGRAVVEATGRRLLVANMREQRGETEGLTLRGHVQALVDHVPGLTLDAVVAHRGRQPSGGGRPLDPAVLAGHPAVGEVVEVDLLDGEDGHDPAVLADVIRRLALGGDRAEGSVDASTGPS